MSLPTPQERSDSDSETLATDDTFSEYSDTEGSLADFIEHDSESEIESESESETESETPLSSQASNLSA